MAACAAAVTPAYCKLQLHNHVQYVYIINLSPLASMILIGDQEIKLVYKYYITYNNMNVSGLVLFMYEVCCDAYYVNKFVFV